MFGSNEICRIDTELNTQTNNCMTILMKEPKKEINILGSVIWGPDCKSQVRCQQIAIRKMVFINEFQHYTINTYYGVIIHLPQQMLVSGLIPAEYV
jgi:hypothetical protein